MTPALVLLALYGAALLVLGWLASRRAASSPEDYFLAGSGLGTVVLFMALFGTNCTPFVLVGVPGRAQVPFQDGVLGAQVKKPETPTNCRPRNEALKCVRL